MSLYNTLKAEFVGPLSADEQVELAKFASKLLRAKQQKAASQVSALLKEAAENIHDVWDFDRIIHLCGHLKTAAPKQGTNWAQVADYAVKGGVVLSATAPLLVAAANALRKKMAHDRTFKEVLSEHPVLAGANTAATERHFNVLKSFAPDIAKNSLVAGNVLLRMHRLGPAMMDIPQIKEFAQAQNAVAEGNSGQHMLGRVGDAAKSIGEAFDPSKKESIKEQQLKALQLEGNLLSAADKLKDLKDPDLAKYQAGKRKMDLLTLRDKFEQHEKQRQAREAAAQGMLSVKMKLVPKNS